MTKTLMVALALVALAPITAHAADRIAVAEQVAAQCRKDWPTNYTMQVFCRESQMEAFDKLQQEDELREAAKQDAKNALAREHPKK
jgi:hypothetical protein